jgi:hypothetical protein
MTATLSDHKKGRWGSGLFYDRYKIYNTKNLKAGEAQKRLEIEMPLWLIPQK